MSHHRAQLLYEGKAKRVYRTDHPDQLLVEYKDDATAFNAQKRGTIQGKGAINNAVSERIFRLLDAVGIPNHLIAKVSDTEQLVRAVTIIPVEVIVRNRAAGSFAARYGVEEGTELDLTVIEWCLKNDALGDPLINDAAVVALGIASPEELEEMFGLAMAINDALQAFFAGVDLELIDFKVEFGRTPDDQIILADEISGDTCRLWDVNSGEKLDKDRFRRDLGGVEEAYREVEGRILGAAGSASAAAVEAAGRDPHGQLGGRDDHHHGHQAGYPGGDTGGSPGGGTGGSPGGDPAGNPGGHPAGEHHHAIVDVMLKRSILDPQGRAVQNTLQRLGHDNIVDLRVGKRIELTLTGEGEAVREQLLGIAETVLSNPVMEEVEVAMESHGG